MLDVVCSTAPTIRIGGSDIPTEAVKDRFLQLDSEHIMIRKMGEHPEQYVRQPGRDFTRPRTLTFETVISLLLTMSENSIGKILIGQFQNSEKHRRLRPLSSSVISCCPRRWKRCFTASRPCCARKKLFAATACRRWTARR